MAIHKPDAVIEYDWRTERPFASTFGGANYDVLPCKVEFHVTFRDGKTALEFEKMTRGWLEEHGASQ